MTQQSAGTKLPVAGVLKRYPKKERAALRPTGFLLIKQAYTQAIEYTGVPLGTRGLALFVGLVVAAVIWWMALDLATHALNRDEIRTAHIVALIAAVIFGLVAVYILLLCIRIELFRPLDEPVIFDRLHRKIYQNYRETYLGLRGLLQKWPCKTAVYDWENVHAEHHVVINANTATVSRQHSLVFIVEQSQFDPTVIASFRLGSIQMGEESVPAVWEHIRRFMEEDGPHVPPGESLVRIESPPTFGQLLSNMGPYGRDFNIWWRNHRITTILAFLFSPVLFPGAAAVATFSWLSYATSVRFDWPDNIAHAIGQPIHDIDTFIVAK